MIVKAYMTLDNIKNKKNYYFNIFLNKKIF
jgi:hypothetical protein